MSGAWIAVGPPALLDSLVPLRDAHARSREALLLPGCALSAARLARTAGGHGATVLIVEDPRQPSARSGFATPFADKSASGGATLGWLRLGPAALGAYARRAAALLDRAASTSAPFLLLGSRDERYQSLLDELEKLLATAPAWCAFQWSAQRIRRARLVEALRIGAAAALYTGHGTARGWIAYGGLGSEHWMQAEAWAEHETCALLFSLSCRTGSPADAHSDTACGSFCPPFADAAIARGVAGAVLAPLGDTPHAQSRVLAGALASAVRTGSLSLSEILRAALSRGASLDGYAVIGDPALCAHASRDASMRASRVFAPAPGDDLADRRATWDARQPGA
jgi:hypothetical protein